MTSAGGRKLSRRIFIAGSVVAGGGLALGLALKREPAMPLPARPAGGGAPGWRPSAFIHIGDNGVVTLIAPHTEMGQGVKTALPMILAEELEVDWRDIVVQQAELDPAYGSQFTGASSTVSRRYDEFRRLGATARTLLVTAAAEVWGVPAAQCHATASKVHHRPSQRQLAYRELAQRAASLPLPSARSVRLKDPKDFRLLGTRVGGVDNPAIVAGAPLFGIDVRLPGMRHAVYAKCPRFGGKVLRANLDAVKALPGVVDAFVVAGGDGLLGLLPGVAIVAESTWAAMQARRRLEVDWSEPATAAPDWQRFEAEAKSLAARPGTTLLRRDGDVTAALAGAARVVEAWYAYPFIAHATLEPMNCTAQFDGTTLEIWAPSQTPGWAQDHVAGTFKLPKERIRIHPMRSGGGFGRRLSSDYVVEAAAIALQAKGPVKLTWSREDDLRHDHYRAGGFHRLRAGLDAGGKVVGWHDHYVTFSHRGQSSAALAANQFPGRWIDHCTIEQSAIECGIPMGAWRAPGDNVHAWVIQSFVDELAHAAARDPLAFRHALLGEPRGVRSGGLFSRADYDVGRMRAVLRAVAGKSGWGTPLPRGRGRGVAFHAANGSYVAQVVEVTVAAQGRLRVERVVCVCDAGEQIVNLSGAEAQLQGAILDGLGAALFQEIRFESGGVAQGNFNDYPMLRIGDVPAAVEVHFLKSNHPPSGLGEPGLPPLAPALCNAVFAATGQRVRRLPLAAADLRWS